MRRSIFAAAFLFVGLAVGRAEADDTPKDGKQKSPLRMSVSTTLFEGMSEQLMNAMVVPFRGLLKLQTGLDGEIIPTGNGLKIAEAIADDKLQVGVMEGIEFAWARPKHPELRALMVAVNGHPSSRALLVVKQGGPIKSFEDLKGKTVADYRFTRVFGWLFLDRRAHQVAGTPARKYFAKSRHCDFAEDMLEEVLEGKIDAAIIEDVRLDCYKRRKPERAKQLKVLEQSEEFPASVVVYKAGRLTRETLDRLHDGMLGAGKTIVGRHLMTLWQMTGFEKVPADYEASLTQIIKIYPAPDKVEVSERTTRTTNKRTD